MCELSLFCVRYSLELHRTLVLTAGSSALVDAQTLPAHQLALPAPQASPSSDPAVSQGPAISPGTVQQVPINQIHSHSLTPSPASAVATPYQQTHQIQLGGNQLVQPAPVLSVLAYDATLGTFFDPRSGLATKIKGGLTLASLGKTSNKFSPY